MTTIIKALQGKDNQSIDKKVDLIQHQIKSKFVKGLASRSPLILSLMSVLALKSDEIATNRASLYRQFFSLIQKNATERRIDITPNPSINLNFLYALGYVLYNKNLPLFDEIYDELVKILTKQLGGSVFEISKTIDECIRYWEEMGVIEQVQTLTESTITFIHKTFCEFTFAKYIENCNYEIQKELFNQFYNDSNFIEVISFLSHLGLSNIILEFLQDLSIENKKLNLSKYLEVIIESSIDWNSKNVDKFIELCWQETNNTFSTHRYNAGAALCIASSHCWEKMSTTIETYQKSGDDWVKSVTLACLLSHFEYPLSNDELLNSLEFFKLNFPERNQFSDGLNIVFNDPLNTVRDIFIIHLTRRVVSQHLQHPETKNILASYLLEAFDHLSYKLVRELRSIFKEFSLDLKIERNFPLADKELILNNIKQFEKWDENFLSLILFNSDLVEMSLDGVKENFFELGAFFRLLGLHDLGVSSLLIFNTPVTSSQDIRVILFKSLAKLAELDYKVLQKQAKKLLLKLKTDGVYTSIFEDIPDVDIIIDHSKSNLTIDILPTIKSAILLDSEILSYVAANIAPVFVQKVEFESMVCDLIHLGEGDNLFYSAYLGTHLPHELFQTALFEKLTSSQLTVGCKNLFKYLDPNFNKNLYWDSIYNGLSSSVSEVAKAAIESVTYSLVDERVITELRKYYEEWKYKEKPYPKGSGTVPITPRDKLADILLTYNSVDISLLKQMALDSRPDIRKVSVQPLVDLARENLELKKWIVTEVCNGNLKRSFLKAAIQAKIYLDNYEMILPLLHHDDRKIRFIASSILKYDSIPKNLITEQAELLLNDPIIEIREIAHNILKA